MSCLKLDNLHQISINSLSVYIIVFYTCSFISHLRCHCAVINPICTVTVPAYDQQIHQIQVFALDQLNVILSCIIKFIGAINLSNLGWCNHIRDLCYLLFEQ